jgi:putative phosphonate catabolism associated alcohol dehydrogenase
LVTPKEIFVTALVQIFDGPGQPLRLENWPLPEALGAGEVLVEIKLATICGSDLHTLAGQRQEATPSILGHEAVGRVVKVGEGRAGLAPGDRVTWSIADSCGTCLFCTTYQLPQKCRSLFKYGHAALQDGTGLNGCYASHILLRPGTHIVKVSDSLPDTVVAPANCALATVANAISHLPDGCNTAVIQGAGLLGLYACTLLRERGVEHVFCVDIRDQRLDQIHRFGGIAIDGRVGHDLQSHEQIMAAAPDGVDAVLEVAGAAALVPAGIHLLRPGGFYGFVGMVHPQTQLDLTGEQVIRKCLTIFGIHNYSPVHLEQAVRFLEETAHKYPYELLVSPPFPLVELESAIQTARAQEWCRVSVRPNKPRNW